MPRANTGQGQHSERIRKCQNTVHSNKLPLVQVKPYGRLNSFDFKTFLTNSTNEVFDTMFSVEDEMALKVLIVDDSKTIRMIVKKAFKPYDCELFEAENGQAGLELAASEKPDLIILDITMPVMTGVEMLEKMKADPLLKDLPVIMLTAESGKDNVMAIVKMGVKDYMVKPFKGEQLTDRVKKLFPIEEKTEEAE
jgi:CheY-like chemotaxis protein